MPTDPFSGVRWIWMNGELVAFENARVHVLTHALHYGSGMFEGVRCYATPDGPAVFRLDDHIRRLEHSCKVYRMQVPYSFEELRQAVFTTISANQLGACYIRPLIYRGFGSLGVNPLTCPVEVAIAVWPWGKYLGEGSEEGVDVCVSSWRRSAPGTAPAVAKATGNYLNAQLIKMDALTNGYAEGIGLDVEGYVAEGSGENLFIVHNGTLMTPPVAASILHGITRDSILTLAREMGIPVSEESIPRGLLHTCDELFFTGTAVEVTPIRSVDRIPVGKVCPGEVTTRLNREFMGIVNGLIPDRFGWLSQVEVAVKTGVEA